MENSRFAFLFRQYINNTCTKQEEQEFLQLVASSENDAVLKAMMEQLWDEVPGKKLDDNHAVKISSAILASGKGEAILRKPSPFGLLQKIAAVLLVGVIVTGGLLYFSGYLSGKGQVPDKSAGLVIEHTFTRLPDGSTVVLNAGSRLEYPDSFENKSRREVYLIGEGFFNIKHDPTKPFIVHTGKLNTTVLGTAFNVKAFAGETNITVTVTRGKVKVSDDVKVLGIISPNQQITFNKVSATASQESVNAHQAIAWIEKDLFFDDVTLADAAKQLEKRFGVKIIFGNEAIKDCRFTATFVNGESLDQILNIICVFNKVTFEHDTSGTIEISGDGC